MCFGSEPPDNWKITDEIRRGERGAGYLFKQGKSRGNWSKRYFVLTDYSLRYYADSSRANLKGEIVLVGATCQEKPSANKKKMFHFSINHPKCGNRMFYAPTKGRKEQWLNRLSEIFTNIERSGSIFGTMHKKGGMSKTNWQERWCVLAGNNLDYYETAQDSLPKGSIGACRAEGRLRRLAALSDAVLYWMCCIILCWLPGCCRSARRQGARVLSQRQGTLHRNSGAGQERTQEVQFLLRHSR